MKRPPFIQAWSEGTRHRRRYLRKGFTFSLPVRAPLGSPAFTRAYLAAETAFNVASENKLAPTKAGTLDAHVSRYIASSEFQALSENTRKARGHLLRRFSNMEINGHRVGTLPTSAMEENHIRKLTADLTPQTRRVMHQTTRAMLDSAIERGDLMKNVAVGIKTKVKKTVGRHTWSAAEIAQYRAHWPHGTIQRIALEILILNGQRRGDAIQLHHGMIRDDVITLDQEQTKSDAHIPVFGPLNAIIAGTPVREPFMQRESGGA